MKEIREENSVIPFDIRRYWLGKGLSFIKGVSFSLVDTLYI